MATVIYPSTLPKPLINVTRTQSPGFQLVQPLAGPGYVKQLTSDSPATYELTWRMSREKALLFISWFYGQSGLNRGFNRFTISLDTEFGPQDHTFQLTPDNLLPSAQEASNVFSYSATAICRKVPIPAVYTDHSDLIVLDAYNYRAEIDTAMNAIWPESYPEPIVIPGTTAAFTSGLYYNNNDAVEFTDLVTFSRATTSTYIDKDGVLKTAAANEPRFESGGLLIEPQSTNFMDKSSLCYDRSSASVMIDVDGWYDAAQSSLSGSVNGMQFRDGSSKLWPASTAVVFSVLLKGTGRVELETSTYSAFSSGAKTVIDLDSVSVVSGQGGVSKLSSGLYRAWISGITTNANPSNSTAKGLYVNIYGGNVNIKANHAQLEQSAKPTSYIPTIGAAETRAADSASVLMQPHSVGTIFAEFLSDSVAVERIVYTAGAITMKRLATGAISVTAGAVAVTSAVVPSGGVKSAISYDGSTLKLAVNGVVYSAVSAFPSVGTSIVLGASTFANVWQRSEAYDNARLTEVTL